MPFEYQTSQWDTAVLANADRHEKMVGFDGEFSLPTKQRVLLATSQLGAMHMLMRTIKCLQLTPEQGKKLYFDLLAEPYAQDVAEIDQYFHNLLGHHVSL